MTTNETYTPGHLIDPADLTCLADALAGCGARIARDLIEAHEELGAAIVTDMIGRSAAA
jgi:hypothetical protein